jgi:hypothetical protein
VLDGMQARLDRMPEAMGVRRQTVEHPFGTYRLVGAMQRDIVQNPNVRHSPFGRSSTVFEERKLFRADDNPLPFDLPAAELK